MGILVVTSFDRPEEAEHIYETLQQLRHSGQGDLDTLLITKNQDDRIPSIRVGDDIFTVPKTLNFAELSERDELVSNILLTLAPGSSTLFMRVSEEDSHAMILTLLLLFVPNKGHLSEEDPIADLTRSEDKLTQILDSYQASVTDLGKLDSASTEADVEDAFALVEDSYDALVLALQKMMGRDLGES